MTPKVQTNFSLRGMNIMIKSIYDDELPQELINDIMESFRMEIRDWVMNPGYFNGFYDGTYTLTVKDHVCKVNEGTAYIVVSIERDLVNWSYLLVYGWGQFYST